MLLNIAFVFIPLSVTQKNFSWERVNFFSPYIAGNISKNDLENFNVKCPAKGKSKINQFKCPML